MNKNLPSDYLKDYENWHIAAQVSGFGKRKMLEVRIGKREFRVRNHGITKYRGTSSKKAIEVYNSI